MVVTVGVTILPVMLALVVPAVPGQIDMQVQAGTRAVIIGLRIAVLRRVILRLGVGVLRGIVLRLRVSLGLGDVIVGRGGIGIRLRIGLLRLRVGVLRSISLRLRRVILRLFGVVIAARLVAADIGVFRARLVIIALGLIAPHMVIMRLLIVVAMRVPRTARAIAIGVVAGASIDNDCVRLGCG